MRVRVVTALVVFLLAFGVYLKTLTPEVGLVDSGELTVAAWGLGNAHPPGFPLYVMVTHLFTLLPIGSIAYRANLASAFFSALSASMLALACLELLERRLPAGRSAAFQAASLALLFAFSRTMWSYATVAEVYALNTFLLTTMLWLMLSWHHGEQRTASSEREVGKPPGRRPLLAARPNDRRLYLAALCYGLGLGVHLVTIGLTIVGLAVLVYRTAGISFFRSKRLAIAAVCAIAALSVYAYLPIAAANDPVMNWGDPDTAARFVDHVTGKQYQAYVGAATERSQFGDAIGYTVHQFGPIWLPLALLLALYGFAQLWKKEQTLFWFLALLVAANLAWMLVYPILNDMDAYLIPTFIVLVLAGAYGAAALPPRVAPALLVLPLIAIVTAWPYRDRSRFFVGKDYAQNALKTMAPNALLLTSDWQLYAPLFYTLEAEKPRSDVRVVETGLLIRSWYLDSLGKQLGALVGPEIAAYRPLLLEWERTGNAPPETNARLDDLIVAMVTKQVARGGHAYATIDVAMSQQPADANVVRRLNADYDVVPRGVVLEYLPGHALRTIDPVPLETRGLVDGTVRYEPNDVVVTEVIPVYRAAFLMRGRYLAVAKRYDDAIAAYREALELDPENPMLNAELAQLLAMPR